MVKIASMARPPKPFRLASRITADCKALLDALMRRYGITESAIIEQAVREYAEKRGVQASAALAQSEATEGE